MEKWNSNFDSEENDARPCQRPMERARAGPGNRGHGGRRHGQSPLTTGRSPAEYPGSNRRGLHQAACFVQSRARATGPERRSADRPALKTSRPVSDVTPVDHRPNAGTRIAPKPARRPVFYSRSALPSAFSLALGFFHGSRRRTPNQIIVFQFLGSLQLDSNHIMYPFFGRDFCCICTCVGVGAW